MTDQLSSPHTTQPTAPVYLTPQELVARFRNGVTVATLANWRAAHIGPPFTKIGRAILYRRDLLESWERASTVACGANDGGATSNP